MKNVYGTSLLVTTVLAAGGFTTMAMGQDECASATTAVIGANAFNTTTATMSAPAVDDALCPGTFLSYGTSNKDIWFKFTATDSGYLDLSTCFAGSFDTSMVVYTGTCGALTAIACNGDATADASCQQFHSSIQNIETTAGQDFFIRIGGYDDAGVVSSGVGQLNLTFEAIAAGCLGSTDGCAVVHAAPGCEDPTCCASVCAFNAFCCDTTWDADCVLAAVEFCGLFVYQCVDANPAVSNDCATNSNLVSGDSTRVFNLNGCNTDGPVHPAATCNSGNDVFLNDVWYRAQSTANGILRVNTCGAVTFDSKLAVYAMGSNPATFDYNTLNTALVGCNDDGDATACPNFSSDLSVTVAAGQWYLIRVATFDLPGSGTVTFDFPEPCLLPAFTGTEAEACGDSTNSGCFAGGAVEQVALGSSTKGSFWLNVDAVTGDQTRDIDFYSVDVPADKTVSLTVSSASFVQTLIVSGDIAAADCAGITILNDGIGACPSTNQVCLSTGTYYLFVAIPFGSGNTPCGSGVLNEYVMQVTAVDADCPEILAASCAAPGPDSASINVDPNTVPNGLVACAFAGSAFPDCQTGATGRNRFARSFAAGTVGGEISCLNMGVYSVARFPNAANTACALFFSDIPLPATVTIYRDIDNGAPRNAIVTAGDGNDLEAIETRAILIPGGVFKGTINFDPPLCIESETNNLVVEIDYPDILNAAVGTVDPNTGHFLRAAGNAAGPGSNTYCRLSCADAAGQYVTTETIGATFTAQWVVQINGTFAGCASNCPADFNGDGFVTAADLSTLLGAWGTAGGDIDGDGTTTAADLSALLGSWGACQ